LRHTQLRLSDEDNEIVEELLRRRSESSRQALMVALIREARLEAATVEDVDSGLTAAERSFLKRMLVFYRKAERDFVRNVENLAATIVRTS
jgi:hypothetical protein